MLWGVPLLAAAQTGINPTAAMSYKNGIVNFINGILVPVLMAIAFIVFLWGVYKYFILGAADEKNRTDGRQFTLWGIIGFVVILSLWALVNLIQGTLGLTGGHAPPPPTIWGSSTVGSNNQTAQQRPFGGTPYSSNYNTGGQTYSYGTLTQQYNAMQNTCNALGDFNSQCQAARAAYLQNYNAAYPSTAGYNTCIANGGVPEICQCEAGGGVWELSGGGSCSTGGSPTVTPDSTSSTFTCTDSDNPPACQCEAGGGVWNNTDQTCE